jgi:hypothetical protein
VRTVLPCDRSLYFWHIPKTAGTSFTGWLESHFGPDEVFGPHLLSELDRRPDAGLPPKRLFRGHFAGELPRRLNVPPIGVTLLREPRARTTSHLGHIWRETGHYLHERIHDLGGDLRTVLSDPVLRTALTDVQSRYLAVEPRATAGTDVPLAVPGELAEQARFELAPLPRRAVLLRRATRRLLRMSAVGSSENLDDFARGLAVRFGWPVPGPLPRANAGPAGGSPWRLDELSLAELAALDEINRSDRHVYRWGKALSRRTAAQNVVRHSRERRPTT